MATPSLSAPGQGVGFAGYCVLSYQDPTGLNNVAVSFLPTLVRMTQPQYASLQKVNMAINGTVHIFQFATQEPLTWPLDFQDLPYNEQFTPGGGGPVGGIGRPTNGYLDLLSFVRTTLNYSEKTLTIQTPDGQIETVRYLRGIEQFQEAAGQTQRAQFWTGQLVFTRVIT